MNPQIRQLFQPIQPSVTQAGKEVVYQEFLPHPFLQNYIYCYWQLKTTQKLSAPFSYRVVSDGCIDILFELNTPADNFVAGFCRKYTEFMLKEEFHYVGIRFLPTTFPQLFSVNAAELSNKFQRLDDFVPKTAAFITQRCHSEMTMQAVTTTFDEYFTSLFSSLKINLDNRLYNAIGSILQKNGVLNIETDLDVGISSRQLQRLFHFYIGDTPKTFSKVVQFQNILKAKPSTQSLKQDKLFYDVGYYDQSHFIKDFKNFYGVTPTKAFRR